MKKNEKNLITWNQITVAIRLFGGRCFCCKKSIIKPAQRRTRVSFAGFLFHHRMYYDGEPRRKNYPAGSKGTWEYKKDVIPFVAHHPEEFFLLCRGCHHIVELLVRKKSPKIALRLNAVLEATKTQNQNPLRHFRAP